MRIFKLALTIAFLSIPFLNFAEKKTLIWRTNWQVGEMKELDISSHALLFTDNKPTLDTTINKRCSLTITSGNDSLFFVNYQEENQLINIGQKYYEVLKKEFPKNYHITYKYKINKSTLKEENLNSQEVDSALLASYTQVIDILDKNVPGKLTVAKKELDEFMGILKGETKSKEIFGFLPYIYNRKFTTGDTILSSEPSQCNPFKLEKSCDSKVKSFISKNNSESYEITIKKQYDFEGYKSMMKSVTKKASNKMSEKLNGVIKSTNQEVGGDESIDEVGNQLSGFMAQLINTVEINGTESVIVQQNTKSAWPKEINGQKWFSTKDPQKTTSALIETTVKIK